MRGQQLLRTSSAPTVCIFCAHRLAGSSTQYPTIPRKRFSTTRILHQETASPNNTPHEPAGFTFDPHSQLSQTEQRQRALLAERREQRKQQEVGREASRQLQEKSSLLARQKLQQSTSSAKAAVRPGADPGARTQTQTRPRRPDFGVSGQPRTNIRDAPQQRSAASRGKNDLTHRGSAAPFQTKNDAPKTSMPSSGGHGGDASGHATARTSMPSFGGPGVGNAKTHVRGWGMGAATSALRRDSVIRTAPAPLETNRSGSETVGIPAEASREGDEAAKAAAPREARETSPIRFVVGGRGSSSSEKDEPLPQWQHLRKRVSESDSAPRREAGTPRDSKSDGSWVDAVFERHRVDRSGDAPRVSTFSETTTFGRARNEDRQSLQCFRCGLYGHVARDCPKPEQATTRWRPVQIKETGGIANETTGSTDRERFQQRDRFQERGRFQDRPQDREQGREGDRFRSRGYDEASDRVRYGEDGTGSRQALHEGGDRDIVPERQHANVRETAEQERVAAAKERRSRKFALDEEDDELPESRSRKFNDDRRRGKSDRDVRVEDEDEGGPDEEEMMLKAERKRRRKERKVQKEQDRAAKAEQRARDGTPITLPEFVTVATLAQLLNVRYEHFVQRLEQLGYDDVFPGKALNNETSGLIAMEFGFDPKAPAHGPADRDLYAQPELEDKSLLPVRPPVVTIMGHVDHGKTTILDYLRKSSVAAGEAGGITQHIGAFSVPLTASGKTITFLDTPGHAAFLAMRKRGANVTDIVILVVAADDSVKPQTLEAIKHAQAAGVPMVVAVNKIDKEEADIQRVKQDLSRHGVEIEDYGGETQVVGVSGKTGQGMDDLEETVVALSEILDHRAETDGAAEGWVLEASTKERGRVATVLVRRGILKPGCVIVAGKTWGRVRTLRNEAGQLLEEVGPGMPIEVDGWRAQPTAGDEVLEAPSEQKAHDVVEYREAEAERVKTAVDMEAINETRKARQDEQAASEKAASEKAAEDPDAEPTPQPAAKKGTGRTEVPFVIKADVSGSAEAVMAYVQTLSYPLVAPLILESSVGPIHESDIERADAARGHIISFNVTNDEGLKGQAAARGVRVLENNVIYRVLDDVKAILEETLPPVITQRVLGEAEISACFDINTSGRKFVKIAGCKIRNGLVSKGSRVRVTRGDEKIYDGTIDSLKNVKKDVQEMRKGTECGMGFDDWQDFEVGDMIQTYEEVSEKRRL